MAAYCNASSIASGSLKEATPAKIRPSTSGNTTCIAISAGDRPLSASAHAARLDVESAI